MNEDIIQQQRETIRILQQLMEKATVQKDDGYDHNITFGQCVEEYMRYLKRSVKPSSMATDKWAIEHMGILDKFGGMKVDDMRRTDIQRWVDELAERYSPKTVRDTGSLVNTILKRAAKADLIPEKVFSLDYPRDEKKEYRILTKKEFNKLRVMLIDDESAISTGILLMLETGMRIGEACGVQWKDVDFRKRRVSVNKTVSRIIRGPKHIGTPKTPSSIRSIPMTETLYETLKERRQEPELYIASNREEPTEPRTLRQGYSRRLKKWGIEYIRPHDLRHTFATRAIENGVDPKTVAALLGHSKCDITLDVNTNTTDRMLSNAIKKMN